MSDAGREMISKEEIMERVERRIDERIVISLLRFRLWLFGAALANLIPVTIGAFYLGGIYTTNAQALDLIQAQQRTLAARADWMGRREMWEQSVEAWASPKGFAPPRDRPSVP